MNAAEPDATEAAAAAPSLAASAPVAGAAVTMSEPERARIAKASAAIRSNHLLRVTISDMTRLTRIEGKVSHADEAGLHALKPTRDLAAIRSIPDVIPWTRILQVEKHGGSAGKGALFGGVCLGTMGALTGMAFVAAGGIGGGSSGTNAEIAGGAAVGALVGGAAGALLGAAIGAPIPRWNIVY